MELAHFCFHTRCKIKQTTVARFFFKHTCNSQLALGDKEPFCPSFRMQQPNSTTQKVQSQVNKDSGKLLKKKTTRHAGGGPVDLRAPWAQKELQALRLGYHFCYWCYYEYIRMPQIELYEYLRINIQRRNQSTQDSHTFLCSIFSLSLQKRPT